MNKVYKVIWSKAKNCYVVASELAKSHTKSPKSGVMSRALVAGVLACVLTCGTVMPAYAQDMTVSNQTMSVTGDLVTPTLTTTNQMYNFIINNGTEGNKFTIPINWVLSDNVSNFDAIKTALDSIFGKYNSSTGEFIPMDSNLTQNVLVSGGTVSPKRNSDGTVWKANAYKDPLTGAISEFGKDSSLEIEFSKDDGILYISNLNLVEIGPLTHNDGYNELLAAYYGLLPERQILGSAGGTYDNLTVNSSTLSATGDINVGSISSSSSSISANNIKTSSGDIDASTSDLTATESIESAGVVKAKSLNAPRLLGAGSGMSTLGGGLTVAGQVKGVTAGTDDTDAVNVAQLNSAIAGASTPYIGINSATGGDNEDGSGATGTDAIAIGKIASSGGNFSVAIGQLSNASGNYSLSLGRQSISSGLRSIAIGFSDDNLQTSRTLAQGIDSIAIGQYSKAFGGKSIAIGGGIAGGDAYPNGGAYTIPETTTGYDIAFGTNSKAYGGGTTAIGNGARAIADSSLALGRYTLASGNYSTSLGYQAYAYGENSFAANRGIAHGNYSLALAGGIAGGSAVNPPDTPTHNNIAIGQSAVAFGRDSIAQGVGSKAYGISSLAMAGGKAGGDSTTVPQTPTNYNVALGYNSKATNTNSTAIGYKANATGINSFAGSNSFAFGQYSVALAGGIAGGTTSTSPATSTNYNISIGNNSIASGISAIAEGTHSKAYGSSSLALGVGAIAGGDLNGIPETPTHYNVAIGIESVASGQSSVAIGGTDGNSQFQYRPVALGKYSEAIGFKSKAYGESSIAMGGGIAGGDSFTDSPQTPTNFNIAIGNSSVASALNSVALGKSATVSVQNSVALGSNSVADVENTLSVGSSTNQRRIVNVASGVDDTDVVTVGQMNAALAAIDIPTDGIIESGNTGLVTGGTVYEALEARIGQITVENNAENTVAVGDGSSVGGDGAVAVGTGSAGTGEGSVAVGGNTSADGTGSVAVGDTSSSTGEGSVAIGGGTSTSSDNSVVVGTGSTVTGTDSENSVAIGGQTNVTGSDSVALGGGSSVNSSESTALGGNTVVNNDNSVALGYGSNASQDNVVSVGHTANDTDADGTAYGTDLNRRIVNVAAGTSGTDAATVSQTYVLQNGTNTTVSDAGTNAIGQHIYQMTVNTDGQVASGNTGIVTGGTVYDALESRIGQITVQNDAQNTVALGDNSSVSGDGAVAVGSGSSGSGEGSVAIGDTSTSSGEGSVAVGTNTTAQSDNTVAIGTGSTVTGTSSDNSVAIGQQTSVTGSDSVALGGGSSVTGSDATAIGGNTVVNNDNSVAIGSGSNASQDNVVSVGHSSTDLDSTGTAYGSDLNRRIVNVADAVDAHDAVTKGQMDALMADRVGTLSSNGNYILKDNTASANLVSLDTQLKSAVDSIGALSNNAVAYSSATKDAVVYGGTNGTVLRNVKGGAVNETSMEAVNGSQLYSVKQDITGFASDIRANASNIDALNSSVTAALSSVSASGVLVDTLDSSKADKSLSNLSDAGKRLLKTYAEDAVATYLAEQGLSIPAAPMAVNTNSNTLTVTNAGNGSLHVGEGSYVNGTSSIAIGVGNQVNANNSGAFGDPSIINADASYVLGNDDTINTGATGSFIVGNDGVSDAKGGLLFGSNTKATVDAEDGMALGNRSEVSAKNAIALGSGSIADSENTLSIGNSDLKRKIVNVADGDISQNSSEVVTGAQLFATNEKVQKNTEALEKKAEFDASNIDVDKWSEKLATGVIEEGNTGLVNGGTVYEAMNGIANTIVQASPVKTDGENIFIGAEMGGRVVSVMNKDGESRVITGVATNPEDASSAANVGYVNAVGESLLKITNSAFQKVDNKVNKVGASAAALANLPTPTFDGDEKWAFAAGVGHYQGETAAAVGAFYKPTDNVIARVSGSFGNGDEMVGAGVAVSLNKGNTPAVSKAQLVRTINAQAGQIQQQAGQIQQQANEIAELKAMVADLAAKVK